MNTFRPFTAPLPKKTAPLTQAGPAETVTLTIKLSPDGRIDVRGPLDNKVVCLGLLAIAQDLVLNTNRQLISGGVAPEPGQAVDIDVPLLGVPPAAQAEQNTQAPAGALGAYTPGAHKG